MGKTGLDGRFRSLKNIVLFARNGSPGRSNFHCSFLFVIVRCCAVVLL